MKKIIVFSAFFMFLLTAIFADDEPEAKKSVWSISGEAQVFTDMFYFTSASGNINTKTGGTTTTEKWGENIGGSLNVLNSSIGPAPGFWTALYINALNEGYNYSYDLSMQLVMTDYFTRGPNNNTLFTDKDVKLIDILSFIFGDWYLTGTAGIFEGYMGNTGYGGFVPVYDNYSDWCNFKLEYFYVNQMTDRQGANNFNLWDGGSAFVLGMNIIDSFRFAFGTDFGYGGDVTGSTAWTKPYASANSYNAAAMFSGKGIADIVNFDVFYGIFGSDSNTNERGKYDPMTGGSLADLAGGAYKNVFGLYGGLNIIQGLGISLGYSGAITVFEMQGYDKNKIEDGKPDYYSYTLKSPLWSSINLHANYSIGKFDITFNNNISFAGSSGEKVNEGEYPKSYVLGLASDLSDENSFISIAGRFDGQSDGESESWFGYDTAVAVNYAVTDALGLCLQLVNQLGVYSLTKNDFSASRTSNIFYTVLNAQYKIGFVSFEAGLSVGLETTIYETAVGSNTVNALNNEIKLGLPLVFKVEF